MEASEAARYSGHQPTQIGRHDVVCLVGQGGMARVFLAVQRGAFDANKLVAIKQLLPEFARDEEFLAMFVDEARLALRFSHPNVVHTYEVIAEAPEYCLVMEYLEGQTLGQLLRRVGRERIALEDQVWMLTQVLAGLGYAHALVDFDGTPLGIVHRDVTPTNVFVTAAGEVKLLDFGIAKAVGSVSLTRQGLVKGKVGYAAPEQCLAQPSDARSDIFSVGMMLWEAIAKRRRTLGESQLATLRARVEDAELAIEEVVPDVAPELAAACRRALAHDPAGRYQTALEFQTALESYLASRPPRRSAENIGALMREVFAKELAGIRQAVEAHTSASNRTQTRVAPWTGLRPNSTTPVAHSALVERSPADVPADFARPSPQRWLLAAAGVAALVGVLAFAATRGPAKAPAANTTPGVPSVAATLAGTTSATKAPAEAATIRLGVAATPARARLQLDGKPVENPYHANVPSDSAEHELVISADGYEPEVRSLRFERDTELRIRLVERGRGVKVPASPVADPDARASAPQPASEARPRAASAPSSEEIAPGMDLKKSTTGRSTRTIDEQDPYR